MKKILLINMGSLGDIHPYIGMGLMLQRGGFKVVVASQPAYVDRITAAGLEAHGLGPDINPDDPEIIKIVMDPIRGPERLHRRYVFPFTQQILDEALPIARDADLILTGMLGYAVPTLAELCKVPWGIGMLAPMGYWSAIDPPEIPPIPFLRSLRFLGPTFLANFYRLMFAASKNWSRDLHEERRRRGLSRQMNPLSPQMMSSGALNLALFSKYFAAPQRDWPVNLIQPGFISYDGPAEQGVLSTEIEKFLSLGEPPVLVTLGSTNVHTPGKIFEIFHQALSKTKRRALMVVGEQNLLECRKKYASDQFGIFGYAPYGKLMPRCSAVVHQGGVGTTGQAMRSRCPAIIVGSANDQLDNARHLEEVGGGIRLPLKRLNVTSLGVAIDRIFQPSLQAKAQEIAKQIQAEPTEEILLRAVRQITR